VLVDPSEVKRDHPLEPNMLEGDASSGSERIAARWAVPVASALVSLTAFGLIGELVTRYHEAHRESVPGTMPFLYYQHERLRVAMVRDHDYYGWVHVNAEGFRGPNAPLRKPDGVLRIMAVGGSTTFDAYVTSDRRAWPARLELWLESLARGRRVEVINAGVSGYRLLDNLIQLETELYQFRPDIVVLYVGHNDVFATLGQAAARQKPATDTPNEMPTITPWERWLARHSLLYNKLLFRWKAVRFSRQQPPPLSDSSWARAIDNGAERFERELTMFFAAARALGIRVVLPEVVHVSGPGSLTLSEPPLVRSFWQRTVPFAPPEVVLAAFAKFDAVARNVACRFGETYIPLDGVGLAGDSLYAEGDPIHFNDRGADRMARTLAPALIASAIQRSAGRETVGAASHDANTPPLASVKPCAPPPSPK